MIRYTYHGSKRVQDRGIRPEHVDAAIAWGVEQRMHGNRVGYTLTRRAVRDAAREGVKLEEARGLRVIMSEDRIVTAYWLK